MSQSWKSTKSTDKRTVVFWTDEKDTDYTPIRVYVDGSWVGSLLYKEVIASLKRSLENATSILSVLGCIVCEINSKAANKLVAKYGVYENKREKQNVLPKIPADNILLYRIPRHESDTPSIYYFKKT